MAENEKKEKKPSVFSRIGSWFRSLKSETKKISWANGSSVRKNTVIVIISVIVLSALLGLTDWLLGNAVVGLDQIF